MIKAELKQGHPLKGRRMYIPRMSTEGPTAMAYAFRSLGIDARVSPPSDSETLALSARYTTGEECLPQRLTLGNFLKIIEKEDFEPRSTAFLLPTSSGPCRYGQYAPLLRKILKEKGYSDALVFSPTSSDGYAGIASKVIRFKRTAWRAVVVSDIIRKFRLMIRPYEKEAGETDRVAHWALEEAGKIFGDAALTPGKQMRALVGVMESIRDRYQAVPLKETPGSRPLIGVVGEIYIRLNSFSNQNIIRRIEAQGGEAWLADISEWVWYTIVEEERRLRERGRRFTPAMAGVKIRKWIQGRDEARLQAPFREVFRTRPETRVEKLLEYSKPYLPAHMALGEMTLNTGKTIAFYKNRCDGVVDLSPFTCMNGIVTEVVYPYVSRDHRNFPVRIFYFDGVPFDLDGDLEIFMDQVRAFRKNRLSGEPSGRC